MTNSRSTPNRIRRVLEHYRDDPAGFQQVILKRDLWSKQIDVCDSIAANPITVVPAGRAVGKSYLMAGIVLWWLYTRPDSLVITTGPDHRQVVSVLWKEIRRALAPRFDELGHRINPELGYHHLTQGYGSPQRLQVREGGEWQALGFACKSEEGLSGQHAGELLVIVDEASGVPAPIWTAIHGLAAKRLVVVGNPIKYDCHFRELHEIAEKGSETIHSVGISSLECPDAGLESSPVGMASRSFLSQMREIHGEGSPWWRSNILGLFPGQESVRFIPLPWLNACTDEGILSDELWKDHPPGPSCIGVDVSAGVGADRSVVVARNRNRLLEVFASADHGAGDQARHQLAPVVLDLAAKWGVSPERIIYDKGGLVGRGFGSYLEQASRDRLDRWRRANPDQLDRSGPPLCSGAMGHFGAGKGGKLYINRRTANAFAVRARLDPQRAGHVPFYCGGIPEWPALRQELAELRSPTMEMEEGQVKQRLEDKEQLKARLKRSPDLLDAFTMTFALVD